MRSKKHSCSQESYLFNDMMTLASSVFYVFKALNPKHKRTWHAICNSIFSFRRNIIDDCGDKQSQFFRRNQTHWLS